MIFPISSKNFSATKLCDTNEQTVNDSNKTNAKSGKKIGCSWHRVTKSIPIIFLIMKNLREWINEFFLNELVFDRNKMWHLLPFLWRNWSKTRGKCALYRVFIERSRIFPMLRKEFKHAKMGLKLKCYWQIKAFLSQHSVREQASCSKQRISPLFFE